MPSNSTKLHIGVVVDHDATKGYFLKEGYVDPFLKLGAYVTPLIYDNDSIDEHLDRLDGICLTGSPSDIDPSLYGATTLKQCGPINHKRAHYEQDLLDLTLKRENKPILAICWGMQMLNVHLGGTLYQDLPTQRPSHIRHEQEPVPSHEPTHWVEFIENGKARELFNTPKLFVNSTHHQAVDKVGPSLVVEGKADDGVIECVRHKSHAFCWGVQWHPERLAQDPIIGAFLEACRRLRS